MMKDMSHRLTAWLILLLLLTSSAFSEPAQNQKKKKNMDQIKQEEIEDYWKKWLKEDVVYIIVPEEAGVFKGLTTEEERESFVEQFWRRRDPDPRTGNNEFRAEHFRRIEYANENYHAGIDGWKTDRGMIYIKFGPPDRRERHPIGGAYLRPIHEGGGGTSTFPFELWNYRHLPGIGSDVEIEFVDLSGANLYKMTSNPFEKDEFFWTPWAGNTFMEDTAIEPENIRYNRLAGIREGAGGRSQGIPMEREKDRPMARVELLAQLTAPPPIELTDLQTVVTTRVEYDNLPFNMQSHFMRMTEAWVLTPLSLEFPNSTLSFEEEDDFFSSRLQVYGQITDLSKRIVYEFDDEIVNYYRSANFKEELVESAYYYRSLALKPGRYKLHLAVKDQVSERVGTLEQGLAVPGFESPQIRASSVVLSSEVGAAPPDRVARDPFVFGSYRLRPRFNRTFANDEYLGVYFELYNMGVDSSTLQPSLYVEYAIRGYKEETEPKYLNISRSAKFEADHTAVPILIDISTREPGNYQLLLKVKDEISGNELKLVEPFKVVGSVSKEVVSSN